LIGGPLGKRASRLQTSGFLRGPVHAFPGQRADARGFGAVFSVNQGEKSASIKVRRMAGVGGWRA
jgi:hypothetical protein